MDELLEQFLIEGPELVQQASDDLLALDHEPQSAERIDGAFRAIHTLKGSVGLFDLPPMGLVLHAAEDLLSLMRSGARKIDRAAIDVLVAAVGQTERWLADLTRDGGLPDSARAVAEALAGRVRTEQGEARPGADTPRSDRAAEWADALRALRPLNAPDHLVAVRYTPAPDAYFRGDDPIAIARAAPDILYFRVTAPEAAADPAGYDPFACALVIELLSFAPPQAVAAAFRRVADQVAMEALAPSSQAVAEAVAARILRVDAARIDLIADLVDELVVAKNGLGALADQLARGLDPRAAAAILADRQATLDRLAGGLHRAVMGARRVPVTPLLRRFPRLVRELAASLDKEVELEVDGGGVEMDKAVVDGLFEPLTHLLRNAVDHGVEAPGQRQRAGKPPRATLRLTARAQGDCAVIEVCDDGRGVDPAQVRRAALQRGLVSETDLSGMSEAQVLDLVFRPGFSTAGAVTELSGRGVGLDAVRAAADRLGGSVAVESVRGAGATVRLTLPLSVTLTQVMVVSCQGERYAVPLEAVVETARIEPGQTFPVRAGRAIVLRERTLPLVDLGKLMGGPGMQGGAQRVLVARVGDERVGLAIDHVVERAEVVLRPLSGLLARLPGVMGATLMGDGQLMLILNIAELVG